MPVSRRTLIIFSGTLWFCVGATLMTFGIFHLIKAVSVEPKGFSLLTLFLGFFKTPNESALLLISIGLYVGYLKSRYFLQASVKREVKRLMLLPSPLSLRYLFNRKYLLLVFVMIALGIILRFLPCNYDVRGFIQLIIGSALVNGALFYFRNALALENL